MKKKKLLAFVLTCATAAGMLSGCGSQGTTTETGSAPESTGTETAAATAAAETTAATGDVVNINWYLFDGAGQADQQAVQDAMNAYTADKIGVTVTLKPISSGDYNNTVKLDLAAADDVDLCFMANWTGLDELIQSNALMDLTDLLPQYEELYGVMPEEIWDSTKFDGKNYTIPNYKESFSGYSLITPQALADKVKEEKGIDFQSLELNGYSDLKKVEPYLEAVKDEVSLPIAELWGIYPDIFANHYDSILNKGTEVGVDENTGEIVELLKTDAAKDYFTLMHEWKEKGYWKEENTMADVNKDTYRSAGDYGISIWNTVPDNENSASDRYGVPVYAIQITDNKITSDSALGSGWAISAKSKKADACLKYLQLLNTDTILADLFVYGIEGTDYTKDADGVVTVSENAGWTNQVWKATNYKVPSLSSTESADKKEQYTEANAAATPQKIMGFRFDSTNVRTEITALDNVMNEYQVLMNCGFYDPEEYLPKYLDAIEQAGMDKILTEIQTQYDAWKSSQN